MQPIPLVVKTAPIISAPCLVEYLASVSECLIDGGDESVRVEESVEVVTRLQCLPLSVVACAAEMADCFAERVGGFLATLAEGSFSLLSIALFGVCPLRSLSTG
jgi:hypothetical protein